MSQAGLVVLAMAGLWIAYLVPHRLRYRQQLLEARADDRFSERLRVIRVARSAPPDRTGSVAARHGVAGPAGTHGRVLLHRAQHPEHAQHTTRRAGRGDGPMDRPHAAGDRVVADAARRTAAARAARAAALTRRAAAARRRALLGGLLLLGTVAGWGAVAATGAGVVLGALPTALLAATLLLGRSAVVAGNRADARWAADPDRLAPRAARRGASTGVVGRAVHPSEESTEVMARVPAVTRRSVSAPRSDERLAAAERLAAVEVASRASTEQARAMQRAEPAADATWVPVPVPRPAYTLKPAARRGEPAPLVLDASPSAGSAAPADAPSVGAEAVAPAPASVARPTTGGLALDAILARRRASGE